VRRDEPEERLNQLTRGVIGAAIEVHRALGPGFLEAVYETALCLELRERGVPFEQQALITVTYRGRPVGQARLDLLMAGELIVELKAVDAVLPIHTAQVVSYLRAAGLRLGLLINFNVHSLHNGVKRILA
jgi:GxxExxY protein